jgi:hypothetical protein
MSRRPLLWSSANSVTGDFAIGNNLEQLSVGSADHWALQDLAPIDLAFSLPIAPALEHRVARGLYVHHHVTSVGRQPTPEPNLDASDEIFGR